MDAKQLAARLRELEAKATPGPWRQQGRGLSVEGRVDTWDGPVWGRIVTAENTEEADFEGRNWICAGSEVGNAELIAALRNNLPAILSALEDEERIEWIQAQTKGHGRGWLFRESEHGRGMRLHETTREGAQPTVREAIDAARAKEGSRG